jgi:hypothetical protein
MEPVLSVVEGAEPISEPANGRSGDEQKDLENKG